MIKSFSIENFRGIKKLEMDNLGRLTLISGKNNIGKTTVLEALFFLMDHSAPEAFSRQNSFRGTASMGERATWEPLFYDLDPSNMIRLIAKDDDKVLELTYQKDENYLPMDTNGIEDGVLAQFRTATKNSYSLLFRYNQKKKEDIEYYEEGHFFIKGINVLRQFKTNLPGNEMQLMKPTQFVNSTLAHVNNFILDSVGRLEIQGKKSEIISFLQQLDSGITDILTISIEGIVQLYLRINGQLVPIQYAGDGVAKLLSICLAIMERKDGLVLIDELETGFHYSMYGKIWKMIDQISKEANCQVVASTHSYELIAASKRNISENEDFSYFRMGKNKTGITAYQYSYDMLKNALESEMEVR